MRQEGLPLYSSLTLQSWNQQRGPGVLLKKGVWKHMAFWRKSKIQTTRVQARALQNPSNKHHLLPRVHSGFQGRKSWVLTELCHERERRDREREGEREGEV